MNDMYEIIDFLICGVFIKSSYLKIDHFLRRQVRSEAQRKYAVSFLCSFLLELCVNLWWVTVKKIQTWIRSRSRELNSLGETLHSRFLG